MSLPSSIVGIPGVQQNFDAVDTRLDTLETVPHARMQISTAVSIPHNIWTAPTTWNAQYDVGAPSAQLGLTTSRITARRRGVYLVVAQANFVTNGTGGRAVGIRRNAGTVGGVAQSTIAPPSGNTAIPVASTVWPLNAGDYFQFDVYQSSGAALDLTGAYFMMVWLGPTPTGL